MDLCINDRQDILALSSLQFLYLLDSGTLDVLGKTIAPTNPNKVMI
jgi:hypothetical protein